MKRKIPPPVTWDLHGFSIIWFIRITWRVLIGEKIHLSPFSVFVDVNECLEEIWLTICLNSVCMVF